MYKIMKTMCPLSYHHNGFVAAHFARLHIAGTNEPKSAQQGKHRLTTHILCPSCFCGI